MMELLLDTTVAAALAALALLGGMEQALMLAMGLALVEVCSLFAVRMYAVAAPMELNDQKRGALSVTAVLVTIVGSMAAGLIMRSSDLGFASMWFALFRIDAEEQRMEGYAKRTLVLTGIAAVGILAAGYDFELSRLIFMSIALFNCIWRSRPKKKDVPKDRVQVFSADLFRALPEALLTRGIYVIPGAALCLAAFFSWNINTVLPYAIGLAVFSALRPIYRLHGAEIERFGVRWVLGALVTAVCAFLGFNGVFSALYCAWAVVMALLPVQRNGRAWICGLLVVLQTALGALASMGMIGRAVVGAAALACWVATALLQRDALYAAYLPVRAWWIRRKACR